MEYKFVSDGRDEVVEMEEWGWVAIYDDGSYLKQFDDATGIFHQFKEIAMQNLRTFVVQNLKNPEDMSKRVEIHIEEGMTPIFFYRVTELDKFGPNASTSRVPHFGYKENINGVSVKTIMYVHPSGAIAVMNTDGRME